MYPRTLKSPLKFDSSFFLFGARSTGKSSWLKENFKEVKLIDLLDSDVFHDLEANPNSLEKFIPANYKDWIIIDEVQKIPALLDVVHRLIENKQIKFILTGSSARKLKREGVNLLAGRALTYKFYPLTIEELGQDFDLIKSLKYGNLPKVQSSQDEAYIEKYLSSYIKTYLKEEIRFEGFVRNLGDFSRFLEAASFSQGSVLNISTVAREASIKQKTATSYFDLLEDMLISYRLPTFTKRAKRKVIQHSKFYFFDVGIFKTIRPTGILDSEQEVNGPALETLVLQELLAINDYHELGYEINYWRTNDGAEVDFILYGPRGLIAIEIKCARKISRDDLSGLKSFSKDYPQAELYIFYTGNREEFHGEIKVLPVEEALKGLKKILDGSSPSLRY